MNTLYIPIGISGAGKSTWINNNFTKINSSKFILNLEFFYQVYGAKHQQVPNKIDSLCRPLFYKALNELLKLQINHIFLDGSFLQAYNRQDLLNNLCQEFLLKYQILYIYFNQDFDELIKHPQKDGINIQHSLLCYQSMIKPTKPEHEIYSKIPVSILSMKDNTYELL